MSGQDSIESWQQRFLRILSKDDLSPGFFSDSTVVGIKDRTPERWQLAVDMIYRCIVSGLMGVLTPKYSNDVDAFFHDIRTLNPYDESGIVLWNGADLYSTDTLVDLINKHFPSRGGPYDGTVNPAFIEELRAIFFAAGVPWSDAPLLPVITK